MDRQFKNGGEILGAPGLRFRCYHLALLTCNDTEGAMYNFLFDKKSLVFLLIGAVVAGGVLFFSGVLVGVQFGLPFEGAPATVARPAVPKRAALVPADRPCLPEPTGRAGRSPRKTSLRRRPSRSPSCARPPPLPWSPRPSFRSLFRRRRLPRPWPKR